MAKILESAEMFFQSYEPKVSNRFIMYIDGLPAYLIKTVNRPSVNLGVIKLDHINIYRKLKGKAEWNDITLSLYDPVTPSAAQAVMEWIRLSHESISGRDGYGDFYKKDVSIQVLGPVGDVVEEWTLKGAFVQSAEFGQMDWSAADPVMINVVLSMDYCILQY